MSTQVGSTTESGVTEDAGCLVPMHFKVLGQRSKMLVNTSTETARKTPWTLHHHLTSCIANMLPFPSHPPCNTSTVSWPRFLITLILIKWGVQKKIELQGKSRSSTFEFNQIKFNQIKFKFHSKFQVEDPQIYSLKKLMKILFEFIWWNKINKKLLKLTSHVWLNK